MTKKLPLIECALDLCEEGPITTAELYEIGYHRSVISKGLRELVSAGKLVTYKKQNQWYYELPKNMPKPKPKLPDLPDDVLLLMGYTKLEPQNAKYVHGYMSKGKHHEEY